jgi:endonuclease YncB( thermonuclease family)
MMSANARAQSASERAGKKKEAPAKDEAAPATPSGPPVVAHVISGDLLQLSNGEFVRLMGADAPVMPNGNKPGQEPWASKAREFTENFAQDKEIVIKNFGLAADEYGRRIGLVYIGEDCLDLELIKQGFAVTQANRYLNNQDKQLLLDAQREARAGYRGIWNFTNPLEQPPREFRAANSISEGDDSKNDAWKVAAKSTPKKSSPRPTNSGPINSGGLLGGLGGYDNSKNSSSPEALQAAGETLEALRNLKEKLEDEGLKGSEMSRMVKIANEHYAAMSEGKIDHYLARDLKDAIDAYSLVVEALKRRDVANDAERSQYKKYIDSGLEIADKSLASASQRYEQLNH